MGTLLSADDTTSMWYPHSIDNYKTGTKIPRDTPDNCRLNSNFAYSMQYIEYIEQQLNEIRLTSVLTKMLYKSYIITGMGIIELVFVYLLHSANKWRQTEWNECYSIQSNPKEIDGIFIKSETRIFEKVPVHDMRMDLDSMIKRAEKTGIITIDHQAFPALKKLRELRNRVHLQSGENAYDHDYNKIGIEEMQLMRRILYAVLTAPEVCAEPETFEFINENYQKQLAVTECE